MDRNGENTVELSLNSYRWEISLNGKYIHIPLQYTINYNEVNTVGWEPERLIRITWHRFNTLLALNRQYIPIVLNGSRYLAIESSLNDYTIDLYESVSTAA